MGSTGPQRRYLTARTFIRKPVGDAPRWTKIDYEAVAKALRDAHTEIRADGREVDTETMNAVIWQMCRLFKADNDKFEELKFIAACTESV